jgi:8-oxo-dGTP diphosphatase
MHNNIGVFAVIEQHDQILLVKKNYGNKAWILPGGSVEKGETLENALIREVKEETNQDITALRFIAVFYNQPKYELAFCYKANINSPNPLIWPSSELESVQFFSITDLPLGISPLNKIRIQYYLDNRNKKFDNIISTL